MTHDEIQTGLGVIDKYLNLKTPLEPKSVDEDIEEVVDDEVVEKAQDIYEQYFFRFSKLDLSRSSDLDLNQNHPKADVSHEIL